MLNRSSIRSLVLLVTTASGCSGGERGATESAPAPSVTVGIGSTAPRTSPPRAEPPTTEATPITAAQTPQTGLAVRGVTDGDTFTLADGRRVRLAQVDAPETNECFGSQSTGSLRALVDGETVTLRRPSTGPEHDRYGRTLAEVSVGGRSVNETLVHDGAAEWYEEFAGEDAELAGRLRSAESGAKIARKGLWSACASPASLAATAPPSEPAAAASSGNCDPAYPDDCIPPSPPDLDCPDIDRTVRVDHNHGDPHRFDADKNGWGCESYG